MPDVLFEALVVTGIVLLLWRPRPGLAFVILAGLALGTSAPVRQVGEALILPALIYVLAAARDWRTRLLHGAALTVCFALPVVGYMGYSKVVLHYGFEMSNMGDAYLYGRTAHAADCATLKLPPAEQLCARPRAGAQASAWTGWSTTRPRRGFSTSRSTSGSASRWTRLPLQREFAYAVIKQQPMRVTGDIARDSIKIFALTRNTVEGDTPIKRWQFQNTYPVYPPGITAERPEERHQPVRRGRGRESAGPPVRRHRAAVLPAARRVHAGTGVPARAAGRDRRDLHLPQARSGEPLPWPACWSPGPRSPCCSAPTCTSSPGATSCPRWSRCRSRARSGRPRSPGSSAAGGRQDGPARARPRSWRRPESGQASPERATGVPAEERAGGEGGEGRTYACSPPAWSTRTSGYGCAGTRSSGATAPAAPTRSWRSMISRSSSRPRTTASTWSRNTGTRSGGAAGPSRRAAGRRDRPARPASSPGWSSARKPAFGPAGWSSWGSLHCAQGLSSQGGHFFLATGLEPGPHDREHEEQDMRQEWVPRARFEDMIRDGRITDDSTLAAYALLLMASVRRHQPSGSSGANRSPSRSTRSSTAVGGEEQLLRAAARLHLVPADRRRHRGAARRARSE